VDVVDYLNKHAPDAITPMARVTATWLHRFHRYTGPRSQLAPTSGAMGYGVPAAIAAKTALPDRTVVCSRTHLLVGMELATAGNTTPP
jgi:acetolactate synthase-1/2/3 large subunit